MPALLTSTSTPPRAASAASTSWPTSSSLLTSHARPAAQPRCASMATAASTSAGLTPATKTLDPSSRNRSAAARPIPLVPPLIKTPLSRSPRIQSPADIPGRPSLRPPFREADGRRNAMARQMSGIAAAAALTMWITWVAGPPTAITGAVAGQLTSSSAGTHERIQPPVSAGTLHIEGDLRDGGTVTAAGLRWRPGRLPAGDRLLSFEVGYSWQACGKRQCRAGADSTATPFAAQRYVVGHADNGRRIRVTVTATEVVQTAAKNFTFKVLRVAKSVKSARRVASYPLGRRPVSEFVNGLPEPSTASAEEYFQLDPAHFNAADGPVVRKFRVDKRSWKTLPARGVFYTGKLRSGRHRVSVVTSDQAGRSRLIFRWRVSPMPAPMACHRECWYPPHLNKRGKPMRWDWQIGRTFPLKRTGQRA